MPLQGTTLRGLALIGLMTLAAAGLSLYGAGCGGSGVTGGLGSPDAGASGAGSGMETTVPAPGQPAGPDAATAVPQLTLKLATQLDTSTGTVRATALTKAALLNTAKALAKTAVIQSGAAVFDLTGLTAGHYFIRVNGLASDLVPTKIDNPAVSLTQYVGRKLRSSVIGSLTAPTYRFETYPSTQGHKSVVKYSNGTGATPLGYAYAILQPGTKTIQIRYLGTATLLTSRRHAGPHSFASWMLGPSSHGKSAMSCASCHGSLTSHPTTHTTISDSNGWCFKCHYGSGGPSGGFVKPTQ